MSADASAEGPWSARSLLPLWYPECHAPASARAARITFSSAAAKARQQVPERKQASRTPGAFGQEAETDLTYVVTGDYNRRMQAVGIRELKSKLSEYIRRVRSGEVVLVTDRGEVVAELRQPSQISEDSSYPLLMDLVRQGKARVGQPNDSRLYTSRGPVRPAGTALRLINAERDEE